MQIRFYGAAREVTGSMHMLETEQDRILLDCGLFQGRRRDADRKNRGMPFSPDIIANVILSHAHIDHSGRIPLLTSNGFTGQVFCNRATADACEYLLPDSAHIQESDADYLNYKRVRESLAELTGKNREEIKKKLKKNGRTDSDALDRYMRYYGIEKTEPLYTSSDAEQALTHFAGQPYRHPVTAGRGMECVFYDAGHILGSAITMIRAQENGRDFRVCYTGDIGRFDKPIIRNPELDFEEQDRKVDLMLMESTYGNRTHEPVADMTPHLKRIITETVERGGTVLIPAFAFGRTQELLYAIHELYNNNEVPKVPIYVDSPLATRITRVYGEHPEVYDRQTHLDFLREGMNPFMFDHLHFTESVEESMALMREEKPHIVLSASGMCEGGRILHHLRYKIHNEKNTILIVGYMAAHTLGRRLLEKGLEYEDGGRQGDPPMMRFMNKEYPLKARVVSLEGFSAHADRDEILRFLNESNLQVKRIALVHGEEDQMDSFAGTLKKQGYEVFVPRRGEGLRIRK
ncbi:MAG: MBL fold metallo-hydrolase [Desulfobacteraceae bacterium]|nr:MBL fold metallo-hydrolase [Desulfobacteraceae bacterium]